MKLYDETDWMDLKPFMKRIANGRELYDCGQEIQAAIARKIITSPVFFIRNFLQTVDKEGEVVLQDPWLGQTLLDVCCESQRQRNIAQQVVEIKARKVGFTQHNISRGFTACMKPNNDTLVLVQDEDVANDFMQRVGTFYNQLPAWLRPMKRIDNPKLLIFDNPRAEQRAENPGLNSSFTCTVPSGIRGNAPKYFIWSEAAFTKNWEDVVDGVLNGMGASVHYCQILDSTPNGEDDFYFPLVMEAIERNPKWVASWERKGAPTRQQAIDGLLGEPDRPKDGWVPVFMPWHWHEEFTTKDESPIGQLPELDEEQLQHIRSTLGKIEKYGGEEETDLIKRFGVSIYRIAWRRWKIDNHTMGRDWYERILTFRQENLSDYRSGFVKLGRSTFDIRGMEILGRQVCEPAVRGKIRYHETHKQYYVDQTFHSDWDSLRIYATPDQKKTEDYVIGVDGSNAWYSNDGDAWVAQVIRRSDRKQVAVHEMRCPPSVVRDNLRMLYEYYNRPLLGIEMEGQAVAVAHELFKLGVTRQYRWKRFDTDPYKQPGTDYLGWETSSKSRGIMQGELVEAIGFRDEGDNPAPTIILRDRKTFDELGSCTRDEHGKIANHGGGHDDHVIALMIALAIDRDHWEPQRRAKPPKDDRPDNPLLERYPYPQSAGRNRPSYDTM